MPTSEIQKLNVTRIAGALGAEISGVDLSADLDDELVSELRSALLQHLVIFFHDQHLTPQQLVAVGRRFGRLQRYPFVKGLELAPEVIEVSKLEHERVNFGGIWHTDTAYLEEPPLGSMLLAKEVPPYGGDTLFANMYLAYDGLSPTLQRVLSGLSAVNSSAKADVSRTREDRVAGSPGAEARTVYEAEHPVVRTHPETGRKCLYVNIAHTVRFVGMTAEESEPLLNYLFAHQIKPEFTCRFRWRPGSLAFWDNRATQHNPINDYHGFRRRMLRITIAGERPA